MASKYIINRSNYTIKRRHQLVDGGAVYENDFMAATNLGSWDSGSIPHEENNFRMFYRRTENAKKKPYAGTWLKNPNGDEDYWRAEHVKDANPSEEEQIKIKSDYHSLLSFAYYGSCEELVKSTIKKIITDFPGGAYVVTADTREMGGRQYYAVKNPFLIDFFGKDNENDIKNFQKNSNKYILIANDNEFEVISASFVDYDYCEAGDIISMTTIVSAGMTVKIYKINTDSGSDLFTDANPSNSWSIVPGEELTEAFFDSLDDFGRVLLNRDSNPKYTAVLDWPHETENGVLTYRRSFTWPKDGDWNIDIVSPAYSRYIEDLLSLSRFYDEKYTNNLWSMLTHDSIKSMDISFSNPQKDEGPDDYNIGTTRLEGLLWAYGRQFDELKRAIDNIKNTSNVTYGEDGNLPDYFLSDVLENAGWDVYNVDFGLGEDEVTIDWSDGDVYPGVARKYTPEEVNYLFLRNLKLNSKSILMKKGTRDGIESLLGLFGLKHGEDYIISEKVALVTGNTEAVPEDEFFELERLNAMKTSVQVSSDADYLQGLPFAYISDGTTKYLVPWFSKKNTYDGDSYFQMYGGWNRRDILDAIIEDTGYTYTFYAEDGDYTYDETIKNLVAVDTLAELSAVTNEKRFVNSVCYVEDLTGLDEYFEETDYSILWHYFILKDAGRFDEISTEGWCPAGLNGVDGDEGRIAMYVETVVEDYAANNPHNGYLKYDGGNEFIDRIAHPFKWDLENDNEYNRIFADEAFDCDGIISDFEEYEIGIKREETDDKKVWFFHGESENESRCMSADTTETLPYSVTNFNGGTTNEANDLTANAIINTKVMNIDFITQYDDEFRAYFEKSILPYLKQMIPSTTIWGYSINHGGGGGNERKYTVIFKTIPSDARITLTVNGTTIVGNSYTGTKGEVINWMASKDNYVTASGTVVISKTTTVTISLQPVQYTFTIIPSPADATVRINGAVRSTSTVNYGDRVSWNVSRAAYITQSGSVTITGNTTLSVELEKDHTIVIPCVITFRVKDTSGNTLSNANIEVNGRRLTGTTYSTKVDAEVAYRVTCVHYEAQSGLFIADGDRTVDVVLQPVPETRVDIYTIPDTTKVLVSDDFNKNKELTDGVIVERDGEEWRKFEYVTDEGQTVSYNASADDRIIITPDSGDTASEETNGD